MRPFAAYLLTLAALCAVARAAPEDPVAALGQRVEALERVLAELPSALEALHGLDNRVQRLAREVERLAARHATEPEVVRALDGVRAELVELERRIERTRGRRERDSPVSIAYADGLELRTEPVVVRLSAGLQGRYLGIIRPTPVPHASGFDLHHAQLALGATLLGVVDVQAMFDFGLDFLAGGAEKVVRDLYVQARPVPWLRLRAGQFKVPYARQHLVYSLYLTFTERSFAMLANRIDRDLGGLVEVALFGERILLQGAVTNGAPLGVRDANVDLAYTVRVVGQPLGPMPLVEGDVARTPRPRIAVGAAFHYDLRPTDLAPPFHDVDRNGRTDNVEIIAAGLEAALKWRGLAVETEYFYRRERAGFGRPVVHAHGVYAQASMMLWRGLQAGARFSWADVPALGASLVGVLGDGVPRRGLEAGGVVSYYLWADRVRAQVGYAYRRDVAPDPFDPRAHEGHVIDVKVQAGF